LNWVRASNNSYFGNSNQSTTFLVFAKKVNQTTAFGMVLSNDDGDMAVDITYPVPQYAGSVQPPAAPTTTFYCPDGIYQGTTHDVTVNLRSTTNRIVLVNLPDSTSSDIWYSCPTFIPAGASNTAITLTIIRRIGIAYQVPSLHIFSLDGPINGGSTYGIQYHNASGTLVYDSSAENITISDLKQVDYPGFGNPPNSTSMSMPTQPGVAIPYLQQTVHTDTDSNNGYWSYYIGIVQRQGSTLYYKLYLSQQSSTYDPSGGQVYFDSQSGIAQGNYTMAVNISQLSPATVTGQV
jgi:hypothetical protein